VADSAVITTPLRTPRLLLREPCESDLAAIASGCADPEVARFIPVIPIPYTDEDARSWLSGAAARWRQDSERALAITANGEPELLLGVVTIRLRPGGSLGYWMRSQSRGQGLTSEAVIAVCAWAQQQHGLVDLFVTAHPLNIASRRVAEKAGFVSVGLVDHEPFRDGARHAIRFEQRSS
jgi:RimJ/RimL family protein N-acetyltransferase